MGKTRLTTGILLPRIQKRPDGELFRIVSRGIRMTEMPGFGRPRSDAEIRQLVAALRRLPQLTDEEIHALAAER